MRTVIVSLVILAILNPCKSEDPGEDDIITVRGYPADAPRVFSGKLEIKNSASLHYILVESKKGKGNNDPLTMWMSSQPGCSSKIGFLTEIGPYLLPPGTKFDKNLTANSYSWHQVSNLLFIDGPQGVGFSVNGTASYVYNDQNAAEDFLNGLLAFFVKFPSFRGKSFYLAGESYAGKFIPDLAIRIASYDSIAQQKIGLNGIIVGNGVMDLSDNGLEKSQINYMFSHNFIDPTLDKYWDIACQADPSSAGCAFFLRRYDEILAKVNFHHIYGTCYPDPSSFPTARTYSLTGYQNPKMQFYNNVKKCQAMKNIDQYFNNATEWHAPLDKTFVTCNQQIYTKYERSVGGSMNEYSKIITDNKTGIHLFAGDWDDIVPVDNTIKNIEKLGLRQSGPLVHLTNKSTNQHIGFQRKYIQGNRFINYWIIKGAGHQVSQQKPDVLYDIYVSIVRP